MTHDWRASKSDGMTIYNKEDNYKRKVNYDRKTFSLDYVPRLGQECKANQSKDYSLR